MMAIVSKSDVFKVFDSLREFDSLSLDCETTGLNSFKGDSLFSFAVGSPIGPFYFNFKEYKNLDSKFVLDRSIIQDLTTVIQGKTCVFANAKFDMHFLAKEGVEFQDDSTLIYDILVMDRFIFNKHLQYNLKSVAERYGLEKLDTVEEYIVKHKLYTIEKTEGKKTKTKNKHFDLVPFDLISTYAKQDANATYLVYKEQLKKIDQIESDRQPKQPSFKEAISQELELTKVLFFMEQTGIKLNREHSIRGAAHGDSECEAIREKFTKDTGCPLVDSNKYLSLVFERFGVKGGITEKGNASFTDKVLSEIDHPIANLIKEHRDASKRANTYFKSFLSFADQDEIVHPSIRQTGADTFRFSITNPALQTLNAKDEGAFKVRDSFIARPGFKLVAIDYEQQEYRLAADYAGEMPLIAKINNGEDTHQAVGDLVGITRDKGKTMNFLTLYGGGDKRLAAFLGISLFEAKKLRREYFERLPRISNLLSSVKNKASTFGSIYNFAGAILRFPRVKINEQEMDFSYKAPNYLIQSSGAFIMRKAMVEIHKFLRTEKCESRMILSIHDEILFEIHVDEMGIIPIIRDIMKNCYTPINGCFMGTSVSIGDSWGNLNEQETRNEVQKESSGQIGIAS